MSRRRSPSRCPIMPKVRPLTAEIICVYGPSKTEPIAHLRAADIGGQDWDRMAGGSGLLGRCTARLGVNFPFAVEIAALGGPGVRQAALLGVGGRPLVAVAGDRGLDTTWRAQLTDQFPDIELCFLKKIPLDRRHNSKIDYSALYRTLLLTRQ